MVKEVGRSEREIANESFVDRLETIARETFPNVDVSKSSFYLHVPFDIEGVRHFLQVSTLGLPGRPQYEIYVPEPGLMDAAYKLAEAYENDSEVRERMAREGVTDIIVKRNYPDRVSIQ